MVERNTKSTVSPLIIVGMHRSGTSLVSRVVSDLGVRMGWRQERNAESRAFLSLNKWILTQAGAAWDYPEPVRDLLADFHCRDLAVRFCEAALTGRAGLSFLGPLRWLTRRTPANLTQPWGWKDPRNTLTLPLWLELFPEARVLHVLRHGLDVAVSLNRRHQQRRQGAGKRMSNVHRWRWRPGKRLLEAGRVATLPGAMRLWEYYAGLGQRAARAAGERGLEVRYEDLLRQPEVELARLSRWLGLAHTARQLDALDASLDPTRAEAWRKDRRMVKLSADYAGVLSDFGYLAAD